MSARGTRAAVAEVLSGNASSSGAKPMQRSSSASSCSRVTNTSAAELAEARCDLLYRQGLYASKESEQLVSEIKGLKEKEAMRECTFQPKLLPRRAVSPRAPQPRNYENAVSRMRNANRQRELQQEERWRVPAGENYERLRRLGQQPFSCYVDNRSTARREPPMYYVDVDVGRGRTGRIGVHEGDDLRAKARSFARAFQLGRGAAVCLEGMLQEAYEERLHSLEGDGRVDGPDEQEDVEEDDFDGGSTLGPGPQGPACAERRRSDAQARRPQQRESRINSAGAASPGGSGPGWGPTGDGGSSGAGSPAQGASPPQVAASAAQRSRSRGSSCAGSPKAAASTSSRLLEGA